MDAVLLCQGSSCPGVPGMAEEAKPCQIIVCQMFASLPETLHLLGDIVFQIAGKA